MSDLTGHCETQHVSQFSFPLPWNDIHSNRIANTPSYKGLTSSFLSHRRQLILDFIFRLALINAPYSLSTAHSFPFSSTILGEVFKMKAFLQQHASYYFKTIPQCALIRSTVIEFWDLHLTIMKFMLCKPLFVIPHPVAFATRYPIRFVFEFSQLNRNTPYPFFSDLDLLVDIANKNVMDCLDWHLKGVRLGIGFTLGMEDYDVVQFCNMCTMLAFIQLVRRAVKKRNITMEVWLEQRSAHRVDGSKRVANVFCEAMALPGLPE